MDQCQKNEFEVVHLNRKGEHLHYARRIMTEIVIDEGGQST